MFQKKVLCAIICTTALSGCSSWNWFSSDDDTDPINAEQTQLEESKIEDDKKAAAEKAKIDKLASEKAADEKVKAEKIASEKAADEKVKAEKIASEKAAAEKAKADKLAAEKAAAEKAEADKLASKQAAEKKAETDKIAAEKAAANAKADKLAVKKAKADKLAREKAAAEKAKADKLAREKAAAEKAKADKLASEKAAAKKAKADKLASDKAAAEKAKADKLALEKAAAEKAKADKLASDKAAVEKVKADKLAAEKAAAEKVKADKLAAEKAAADKVKADKLAAEQKVSEQRQRLVAAKAAAAAEREVSAKKTGATKVAKHSGKKTPLGADASANLTGTIPSWSGKFLGTPPGLRYNGSGDIRPDPYAKDKPIFTIHAGNVDQYSDKLTDGQVMLFKKYPDSFYMHIYPSHRDGRYNKLWEERTSFNAKNTKLVNGLDGLRGYTGGVPFPNPKNGAEAIWNGRVSHPQSTVVGVMDDMAVYLNGNTQLRRQKLVSEYPFSFTDNPVGKTDEEISINAAYVHITVEQPRRKKDEMIVVHEALDQVSHERRAWAYIPGARRVRRAPTVGFDTPDGPGGLVTIDDSFGFNGALKRFNWKLVGKKEIYIPYHNYKFDDPKVNYKTLLQKGHTNPDYMRYELHRVWIVEANLKNGERHVYGKRRFYMDEDSWQIVLLDSYDGRGDLWRTGILNTVYDYAVKGYVNRAQVFHDFQNGAYIAMRLINETAPVNLQAKTKGEKYYTPANLRKLGK